MLRSAGLLFMSNSILYSHLLIYWSLRGKLLLESCADIKAVLLAVKSVDKNLGVRWIQATNNNERRKCFWLTCRSHKNLFNTATSGAFTIICVTPCHTKGTKFNSFTLQLCLGNLPGLPPLCVCACLCLRVCAVWEEEEFCCSSSEQTNLEWVTLKRMFGQQML